MKRIYKYPLALLDQQSVEIKRNARLLTIQFQRSTGDFCLWAIVDTKEELQGMAVYVLGTGREAHFDIDSCDYIATTQDGSMVWHWFVEK